MLDTFANILLCSGHVEVFLPTVVLGMIFYRQRLYGRMACSLFFAMVINTLLKRFFKVPLFPHLGVGYAFPSGHMHSTAMFFGYALYKANSVRMKMLMALIMLGEGFALIHLNFHDLPDVLAALGFATLEILCYHQIISKFGEKTGEKYAGAILIVVSSLSLVVMSIIYKIPRHVWIAFYGLISMIVSLSFIVGEEFEGTMAQRFMALLSISVLGSLVYFTFMFIDFQKHFISEIKFALAPLLLAGSIRFFMKKRLSSQEA
jgi:undecaprenyl-diphosphatase